MDDSSHINDIASKITQAIVLVYQALAVIVFAFSLLLAYDWLTTPFIGGFFEQTMVLNGTDTYQAGKHWALYTEGFKIRDQLISVNGSRISNAQDLENALDPMQVGQTVSIVMRTANGDRTVDVTLQPFPSSDRFSYFLIPAFLSLVF